MQNNLADSEVFKGPIRTAVLECPRVKKIAFLIPKKTFAVQKKTWFDRRGRAVRIVEYGATRSCRSEKNIEYDGFGRRTVVMAQQLSVKAITRYRYDDMQKVNEVVEKVTSKGLSVERRYTHGFNEKGDQTYTRYEDSSGLRIETFYQYDYDKLGRISRVATSDKYGTLSHLLTYDYDAQQRIVREVSDNRTDHRYCESIIEYVANGFCKERFAYRNGSLERRTRHCFDSHGNLVELAAYDGSETLLGRTTYTMRYDDIGNWIKRRTESWDTNGNRCNDWTTYQKMQYW